MSYRPSVDRERMRRFFAALATRFPHPARIYLVGGTSLVFERLREQTLDIDVAIEVDVADHAALIEAMRRLKDELAVNVEEASPADFIPLPSGHEQRHEFIERFGKIDLFHFDLYSTALSKIERARSQDLEDVVVFLRSGKIQWERLVAAFQEILPKLGRHSLRQDPAEFERNFRELESMWKSARGSGS